MIQISKSKICLPQFEKAHFYSNSSGGRSVCTLRSNISPITILDSPAGSGSSDTVTKPGLEDLSDSGEFY